MKQTCGIYKITSPSGKVYIGQSRHILKRFKTHLRNSKYRGSYLYNSIAKYGFHNHIFDIIHELPEDVALDVLHDYEILYIDLYKSCAIELLNSSVGGRGREGVIVSQATREKLSRAHKGRRHTEETKLKIGQTNRGKKRSEETKKILSRINTGKPCPMAGKKHSAEARLKISQKQIGRKLSQEHKSKIGIKTKGKPRPEDVKLKISLAQKGKKLSEEHRRNLILNHPRNKNKLFPF